MRVLRTLRTGFVFGALLALVLAGCGAPTPEATANNQQPQQTTIFEPTSSASPVAIQTFPASSTPVSTSTPEKEPTTPGGMARMGCPAIQFFREPDPAQHVYQISDADSVQMAKVGELIEFRLSVKSHWYAQAPEGYFVAEGPNNYQSGDFCIFRYKVLKAGSTSIHFSQAPICSGGMACATVLIEHIFKFTLV